MQAKFHGPYVVEQQLGPVDYVVSTPDRRKTKLLFNDIGSVKLGLQRVAWNRKQDKLSLIHI